MAFAFVQTAQSSGDFFDNASVAVTLGADLTVGNLVVVCVRYAHVSRSVSSVASGTNTITEDVFFREATNAHVCAIYSGIVTNASNTVTVTLSGNVSGDTEGYVVVYEFSGSADPKNCEDTSSAQTAATTTHVAGDVTTTTNESLLVGMCYGTGGTYNPDSDWNTANDYVDGAGGVTAFKIVSGSTTTEDMDITTDANETVANVIAAYVGAAGGGSTAVPVCLHHLRQQGIS